MKSTTDIQMSKMSGNSFNDIYTSYYKKSFFFAKSYVHNDLAAEDIASEALIKLWEKLKAEPVEEKYILPLLLTILKNKALDYLKHEEVKRSAFEVMADWQQQELSIRMSALEACNPDEIFSEEVEKIISATLSTLSEQTRRAFILSRFENKSNKEIAEEMYAYMLSHIQKHLLNEYKSYNLLVSGINLLNDLIEKCIAEDLLTEPQQRIGPEGVLLVVEK